MEKFIQASERPYIPCEHPDLNQYVQLFKQNLIRCKIKGRDFVDLDEQIISVFKQNTELKVQCEALFDYVAEALIIMRCGTTVMPITLEYQVNRRLD